jgi:mRNA interferase HigB
MRIIAKRTLRDFWDRHADAAAPLQAWYAEVKHADWQTPQDIKDRYASASILPNDRVVFDIGGHKYRLVCHVRYDLGIVFVRFVGTHAAYDKIDATAV